jgi:membrane-associated protease RseP (regulator of RpoE activity)
MRATFQVFGALAALLLANGASLAQQAGAGGGLVPPGAQAQPNVPGGLQLQPGGGLDPQQAMQQMQEQMAKMWGFKIPAPAVTWGGMTLEPAAEALLDQLDLPAGKGMLVARVAADSAAAKAGLRKNDLLLKVNADAVPGDAKSLLKTLATGDATVDIVIVRKGKEQTLKGVKLAAAELVKRAAPFGSSLVVPLLPPGEIKPLPSPINPLNPGAGIPGLFPGIGPVAPGGQVQMQFSVNGAKISLKRDGDKASADYEKDKVHISLRGKMDGMKVKLNEITVKDGDESKKYTKVEDVPEAHRDAVNRMVRVLSGDTGAVSPLLPLAPPGGLPQPGGAARATSECA